MNRALALLLWMSLCAQAFAQGGYAPAPDRLRALLASPAASRPSGSPHPSVARVVAPGRDSISYGSCSLVAISDKHGLVITNWHVVNEATGQISVHFPDGFQSNGTVVKVDRDWDLAAIAIWKPPVAPIPLSTNAPQPGEPLTIAGYGSGQYRAVSGACTQYVSPGGQFPFEMVELAASARQGDSGGPILNSKGEMAGVLFGEGHGRTAGSYCGRVQWFLSSVTPPPSNSPSNSPSSPSSSPGGEQTMVAVSQPNTNTWRAAPQPPIPSEVEASRRVGAGPYEGVANPGDMRLAERPRYNPESKLGAFDEAGDPTAAIATGGPNAQGRSGVARKGLATQTIGWREIAGDTIGEQVKTVLAGFGGLAVVILLLRVVSHETPAPKPAKVAAEE